MTKKLTARQKAEKSIATGKSRKYLSEQETLDKACDIIDKFMESIAKISGAESLDGDMTALIAKLVLLQLDLENGNW